MKKDELPIITNRNANADVLQLVSIMEHSEQLPLDLEKTQERYKCAQRMEDVDVKTPEVSTETPKVGMETPEMDIKALNIDMERLENGM